MSSISGEDRKLSVLVVDDEELVADSLVEILNMYGHSAYSLYSGAAAITRATEKPFDVLIIDVVMSKITGIDAAIEICKTLPNCKVILVSGNEKAADLLNEANERGYDFEVLAKPVQPSVVNERLKAMSVID